MNRSKTLSLLVVFMLFLSCSEKFPTSITDQAAGDLISYNYNNIYKDIEINSLYLTMRDSTRIALDYYLPTDRKETDKFPTIVHQTRYWRSAQLRFPFNLFTDGMDDPYGKVMKEMVRNGYAVVNVDVRGTGASFGERRYTWTPEEINDGKEILDWVVQQDWSNKEIGTMGASYSGTTAEHLSRHGHPAVKACLPMYAGFDIYDEVAFPGGVQNNWFSREWQHINRQLDDNKMLDKYPVLGLMIKGVKPVEGEGKCIPDAIAGHKNNANVDLLASRIDFRNQKLPDYGNLILDSFSTHAFLKDFQDNPVPTYFISGWYDGGYALGNIRKFLNFKSPENKLLLGPWEHGGVYNLSLSSAGLSSTNKYAEILKFLDFKFKKEDTGWKDQKAVTYFTIGEDKWKGADAWPPENTFNDTLYFAEKKMSTTPSADFSIKHQMKVDTTWGTGPNSKWRSMALQMGTPFMIGDWQERRESLLSFETAEMVEDMVITGHPLLELYLSSKLEDQSVFAYLEIIDQDGNATYVNEGNCRLAHISENFEDIGYEDVVPSYSNKVEDYNPMKQGEVRKVIFDISPISFQVKKGERLAISFSLNDKDNFELINTDNEVELLCSAEYPSSLIIPLEVQ